MRKLISLSEIGILVLAIFSFAYIIYDSTHLVSAETTQNFQCCEKTNSNEICQNILDSSNCQEGAQISPSECDSTSFCNLGCCVDSVVGTYDKNVPAILCDGANSTWYDDANCNVAGAGFGCCVIGERTYFATQQNCAYRTEKEGTGLGIDWQGDKNEAQCVAMAAIQEVGACTFGDEQRTCKFVTRSECSSLSGFFSEDYLCTSSELNTICEPTKQTSCVEGKDGVYFVDSCGNPANIYDSDKVNDKDYWEKVIKQEDSCNPSSGNANSEGCGNCNRFLGGICDSANENNFDPDYGGYYCKDTSCKYKGKTYTSGESWCVYDGKIDGGDDVVGSRHWKYVCNQGEVQVEPCADYRNEICVQAGGSFSNANCRVNNGKSCWSLNDNAAACAGTLDCMVKTVNFGESFNFDVCVPRYPPGFDVSGDSGGAEICNIASRTCTVVYEGKTWGGCKCVENCECEEAAFTETMNDICRSLGDCGLEVNIEGQLSSGSYAVSGAPMLGGSYTQKLIAMATPVPGQLAEVGNVEVYLAAAGITQPQQSEDEEGGILSGGSIIGLGAAGIGYAMYAVGSKLVTETVLMGVMQLSPEYVQVTTMSNPSLAAFGSAMIAAGIGAFIGSMIAKMTGAPPGWSVVATLAGAVAGFYTSALLGNVVEGIPYYCKDPSSCGVVIGIAISIMIIASLFGSDCESKTVTFTCKQWQPPAGAGDCSKCNDDPLKPCSEYRCKSLGGGCELINKGTTNEICVSATDDGGSPEIEPITDVISDNELYGEIDEDGFRITSLSGECVDAYTPIYFALSSDEPAQCKFDMEMKEFDEMAFDLDNNGYLYNYTVEFTLPDPTHGQSQGLDWTGDITLYIKCKDRFGHETPGFYTVDICVKGGEDVTAPIVQLTDPANDITLHRNTTSQEIAVYTNELATCRWSYDDEHYNLMDYELTCPDSLNDEGPFGYECKTTLPVDDPTNTYYIRCADQPWLGESERNANTESFVYTLNKVSTALAIEKVAPSGDLEVNSKPATVELKVETSGGGRSEFTKCSYSFSGYETMIQFFDTFSNIHMQEFSLNPGSYKVYIECEDETGDVVQTDTRFQIIKDTSSPQIARVFQEGSTLTFITTETADCTYSTDSSNACGFSYNNGESAGGGTEHTISVIRGSKYYIKCEDEFGNLASGCSLIVQAT